MNNGQWLEFIDFVLHPLCPFGGSPAAVEVLVGNGLSEAYRVVATLGAVHLIWQEKHGEVELESKALTPFGHAVETWGVFPDEMDRNDIAVVLYALLYESFPPREIADLAVDETGADARRKEYDVVIALESSIDLAWEIAGLAAKLVDGYAERCQTLEIHQEVVDKIFDIPIVFATDDAAEGHPVNSA